MVWVIQCVFLCLAIHSVVASGSGHGGYIVSTDYTSRYHGPGATTVVLPDGTLADTPEVAAARAAHLAALQKAQALWYGGSSGIDHRSYGSHPSSHIGSHSGAYSGGQSGSHSGNYAGSSDLKGKEGSNGGAWPSYSGPLASAIVLPSGYLADSSDVAAAKVSHLGALAQAYAEAAKWPSTSKNEHNQGWKQW